MSAGPAEVRLGVWLDPGPLPAWLHAAVERLLAVPGVSLTHVFVEEGAPGRRPLRALPFALYERLDRRLFAAAPDPFDPRDPGPLLEGAERRPARAEAAAEALARTGLDLLLHLGSRRLAPGALDLPRLGVWTWSQLELARQGGAPCVSNLERAEPVACALWRLRPEPWLPRVLASSWSALDGSDREGGRPISLHRVRLDASWKSAALPARALRRVLADPAGTLEKAAPAESLEPAAWPGPLRSIRLAALVAVRLLVRRWRARRFDARWQLAVQARGAGLPGESMERFERIPPPPGRFHADPFLARHEGRTYVFFEDGDERTGLGRIACSALDAEGRPTETATVLEEAHHLSYPCVFHSGGTWWMIPESGAARRVALYRAEAFPWRWRLERVLFADVRAVDATVLARDGRLWLFTSIAEEGIQQPDELHVFHADDPRGPWRPHPENPVVSDVRCGRSAGAPFEYEGELYRPAQDGSRTYGGAMALMRVEVLNEHQYRESTAARIDVDWCPGAVATHTFARSDELEMVDVRVLERRP